MKFRSWNEEENQFYYWQDGEYNFCGGYTEMNHRNRFNWQNAQRFLFTNKFGQDIYVGSTLEGTILGSKVKVGVEEDNFGIAHARCIDCKSTDCSKSFNMNDVDILWCYNLKVVEDNCIIVGNKHQ